MKDGSPISRIRTNLIIASVLSILLLLSSIFTSVSSSIIATVGLILFVVATVLAFVGNHSSPVSSSPTLALDDSSSATILQAITDAVVVCDLEGHITNINTAATQLTGWTATDAQNLDYLSVLVFVDQAGQPLEQTQTPIQQAISQQTSIRQTLQIQNQSTKKLTYVDIVVSLLNQSGTGSSQVIAILRDVSDQVKQDNDRSDFVSTASHEMRTPVAAIRGFLELALNPKICQIDANAQKYLQKAYSSTEHLGQLFQDLLTVSRSEDGRLPNNPVKINVNDFIKEMVDQLRFSADAKKLTLNAQFDNIDVNKVSAVAPTYFCYVDQDRLREVVTNLFDNAVKYTQQGGVSLKLSGDQKNVRIAIHDSGIGIPHEDIPHLFQKFYRVDNTATREIGGTGLGLYICQEIVESMHGRILVESTMGVGSTFTIELPRVS